MKYFTAKKKKKSKVLHHASRNMSQMETKPREKATKMFKDLANLSLKIRKGKKHWVV